MQIHGVLANLALTVVIVQETVIEIYVLLLENLKIHVFKIKNNGVKVWKFKEKHIYAIKNQANIKSYVHIHAIIDGKLIVLME